MSYQLLCSIIKGMLSKCLDTGMKLRPLLSRATSFEALPYDLSLDALTRELCVLKWGVPASTPERPRHA